MGGGVEVAAESRVLELYERFVSKKFLFIAGTLLLIVVLVGVAVTLGSANITVGQAYAAVVEATLEKLEAAVNAMMLGRLELHFAPDFDVPSKYEKIVCDIRLPRVFMALVVGAALALAGTVMQAILRNPLASPFTIGISSAAGFGAALAIILGVSLTRSTIWIVAGNAFVFAVLDALLIYGISRMKGATPETMILAGVAFMYLWSGMTSFLQYVGEAHAVQEALIWMFGDLTKATWLKLGVTSLIAAACIPYLVLKAWDLNVLMLGDETAKSLGVDAGRVRLASMLFASLLTAGAVCFVGTIGFVGLVAPHIVRMIIGGDHRFLLPASALFGAALLLACDTAARTVLAPVILPVGILTSFMGVPLFLYLILRRRREYW
ncbi:MAG: ABC-type Fe3+-siderophore transport system [Candidatus Alkanophagales archaeon MCA70_species_1]|nr:ABC-type Fe3+-siderophore transport system [Candidatus Alkanophaga volatiphilum]